MIHYRHRYEIVNIKNMVSIQKITGKEVDPVTLVLRKCKFCPKVVTERLEGRWTLAEVRGEVKHEQGGSKDSV